MPVQKTVVLPNGKYSTATCSGADNCAFPAVWSSAGQHGNDILTSLGTDYDVDTNGPFKVAMKAYGGDTVNPLLYFIPQSPLLTAGADVSACVAAAQSPATRRILAPASHTVTTPGTWNYSIKRGSETITGPKVGNAGQLEVTGWPAEVRAQSMVYRDSLPLCLFTGIPGLKLLLHLQYQSEHVLHDVYCSRLSAYDLAF